MRPTLEEAFAYALRHVGPLQRFRNRRTRWFSVEEPGEEPWTTPPLPPLQAKLTRRNALAQVALTRLGYDRHDVLEWLLEENPPGSWRNLVRYYVGLHTSPAERLEAAAPALLEALEALLAATLSPYGLSDAVALAEQAVALARGLT